MNTLKFAVLLLGLFVLSAISGWLLGGTKGLAAALVFSCALSSAGALWSGKIILALHHAYPLREDEAPEVIQMTAELCEKMEMPVPEFYLIPNASPNAFAAKNVLNRARIAVTHGLLHALGPEELEGVLAHELALIKNGDAALNCFVASLAWALGFAIVFFRWVLNFGSNSVPEDRETNPLVMLIMLIVMPVQAAIIHLFVSKRGILAADHRSGEVCGNAYYLASALKKLDAASKRIPMTKEPLWMSHLLILDPASSADFAKWFRVHPPVESRIANLVMN